MPYSPNIPQAGDKLRNSQLDILNNFTAIGSGFALNHVDLNLAGAGEHTHLTMPRQSTSPAVAADYLEVYNFLNASTGLSELYLKRQAGVGLLDVPMTAKVVTNNGLSGWSYLPSGVLIQWGNASAVNPAAATITFPKAFSSSSSYTLIVTARNNGTNLIIIPMANGARTTTTAVINPFYVSGTTPNQYIVDYFAIGL